MTTPNSSHEERITILETRLDTILPNLATKEDIARLEGNMQTMNARQEGKIDGLANSLLIKFIGAGITIAAIAVAAAKYL